jgi:hypothetical protein
MSDTSQTTSYARRFTNPTGMLLRSVYEKDWGRSDPAYVRGLAALMSDLPDERRAWLRALAGRMEAGGFESIGDVPAERYEEVVQRY